MFYIQYKKAKKLATVPTISIVILVLKVKLKGNMK